MDAALEADAGGGADVAGCPFEASDAELIGVVTGAECGDLDVVFVHLAPAQVEPPQCQCDVRGAEFGGVPKCACAMDGVLVLVGSAGFDLGGEDVVAVGPQDGAGHCRVGGAGAGHVLVDLPGDHGGGGEFLEVHAVTPAVWRGHAEAVPLAVIAGLMDVVLAVADGELEVSDLAGDGDGGE